MEAVSGGASVLAFIGLTLQSARAIHQAISDIKNAPRQVQQLASAVQNLQWVLQRLETCRAVQECTNEADLAELKRLVQECNEDISLYEKEAKKIQLNAGQFSIGKAWKKVKTLLQEKDIQRMKAEVDRHVTALGFQLNMLQTDATMISKGKLVNLDQAVSDQTSLLRSATTTCDGKLVNLTHVVTDHMAQTGQHATLLHQQHSDLTVIGADIREIKNSSVDSQQGFINAISCISEQLKCLHGMSAVQSENMSVLLRALQNQATSLSLQTGFSDSIPRLGPKKSRLHSSQDQLQEEVNELDEQAETGSEEDSLLQSISRLSQLVDGKEDTAFDEQAQTIIDDLDMLLSSVSAKLCCSKGKERVIDDVHEEHKSSERDLKRVRGLLISCFSVAVNKPLRRPLPLKSGGSSRQYTNEEIQTEHGRFILKATKRRRRNSANFSQDDILDKSSMSEFTASIQFFFDDRERKIMLTASVFQTIAQGGSFSLCPSISVSLILPDASPVFKAVQDGNVEALQSLISQGKASLRDRNSRGTPLLHHAMDQPEMCRFLIDCGADVNESAPYEYRGRERFGTALMTLRRVGHSLRKEAQECWRLLLIADTDPTIPETTYSYSQPRRLIVTDDWPVKRWVETFTAEQIQTCIDLAGSYIDPKQISDGLLYAISIPYLGLRSDIVDVLLRKGADIHTRDPRGQTCLHIFFTTVRSVERPLLDILVALIKNGANVYAVDDDGVSVSELAYTYRYSFYKGYLGDLWDVSLSVCGYNILEFRKAFPRERQGSGDIWSNFVYTRNQFEELWHGREHLCPYYHAPRVWDPEFLAYPEQGLEHTIASKCGLTEADFIECLDPNDLDLFQDVSESEDEDSLCWPERLELSSIQGRIVPKEFMLLALYH